MTIISKSWAVVQVAVLVFATSGAAFPLVASAEQNHQDEQQQDSWHNDGNHDNEDNQNDTQHENDNNGNHHQNDGDNNEHDGHDGHDNEGDNHHHVTPPTTATVIATKIVCNNESDLPNWGAGASTDITMTTATDYVASHPNCHLTSGWNFQWAPVGSEDPGDNTGASATPWTTFGPTTVNGTVSTQIPATAGEVFTWFREVFQSGYVPFTYDSSSSTPDGNNVSAEFYCNTDHLHYDNYDWIMGAEAGSTYYCVAFNALVTATPPADPTCTETQHLDNHVCVDNTTTTVTTTDTTTGGGHGHSHGSNSPKGQVLGASCGLYMDKHIKFGSSKNDSEQVKKLQGFLNKWMGTTLPLTGVYDSATLEVVKAFQAKYGSDVLKPWNINAPTGLVYLSTLRLINLLECPGLSLPTPELVPWNLNPNAQ